MAETVVEAPNVDEEAGGLRGLLEEDLPDPRGLIDNTDSSLMAAGSTSQVDVNPMVVAQQHADSHQARAAAALEQADAAEERNHHQGHPQIQHVVNDTHSQQPQVPEKVPVSSTPPPLSTVTQDLPQQIVPHTAPIKIPSGSTVKEENGMPSTPGTSDLALSVVSPSNICLCQQPARIPRPRNGKDCFFKRNLQFPMCR